MKRFVSVLAVLLLISGLTLADMPDFASMSFEDLHAMKQALDLEYNSRSESEGRNLGPDVYYVGRDILPGTYYVSMVYPSAEIDRTTVRFYDDQAEMNADTKPWHMGAKRSIESYVGSDPKPITLNDGEIVCVEWGSLFIKPTVYNPKDYYEYIPPVKTIVPKGKYKVGEGIPAGMYLAYPASTPSGAYDLNGSFGARVFVYSEPESCVITLNEGDIFEVDDALAMKKQEPFTFD